MDGHCPTTQLPFLTSPTFTPFLPFQGRAAEVLWGGPWPPGVGLLLHSCVEEMEEGGAVLASVEAHTQLGEVVLIEGSLNGL